MFLVLSVAIVPAGPETELNRASVPPWAGRPARWHPTRAAGRRGPTLPVPTASVQRGGGGEGALETSAHLCPPEEGCPAGGGGGRRGTSVGDLLTPAPQPLSSQPASRGAGAVRGATLAFLLFLAKPEHFPLFPRGLCSYCSLSQDRPSHRPPPSPVPCFLRPSQAIPSSEGQP